MKKKNLSQFPTLILQEGIIKDQLYHALRTAILEGRLHSNSKIPSSRAMAEMMGISRTSVLAGIDRLIDEGYLVTRKGSGTYVSETLPDHYITTTVAALPKKITNEIDLELTPSIRTLSTAWLKTNCNIGQNKVFNIGVGCCDLFPHELWGRLLGRAWRQSSKKQTINNDSAGYYPLREAICHYAQATRGLNCTPEQIIIVNGTQQAMNLTAQVLLQAGDEVWLDDPGYDSAFATLSAVGAKVNAIPSDQEGMVISYGIDHHPNAKLVFSSPSHQFPLGGTLSLERRMILLDWVARENKWILEDDYNSEFRYKARPIQALQGLDKNQRVIYAGTFSKMMFSGFRLGFLVVPELLIKAFRLAKYYADTQSPYLEQATLGLFIKEGYYARHVRRIRRACFERKTALIRAIQTHLPDKLQIEPSDSGIHLVCWLQNKLTEKYIIDQAQKINLGIQPLSRYSQNSYKKQAILIGYANHTPEQIEEHIIKLAEVL